MGDQILTIPNVATLTALNALSDPRDYEFVYVIAEGAHYHYNGTTWVVISGTGDMAKSVYDVGDTGVVDEATEVTDVALVAEVTEVWSKDASGNQGFALPASSGSTGTGGRLSMGSITEGGRFDGGSIA